jgi:hypothetical protein
MKRTSILLAFLIIYIISYGQTINYGYDSSGNRTDRYIGLKSTRNADNKVNEEQNQQSFSDQLGDIEIKIYPNPSKGELTIEIENLPEDPVGWIGVYDMSGKLVLKHTELTYKNLVNLSSSDNGMYILRIVIGDDITEWKILKE